MKELVEEVERWDMEPRPASLWWTSTYGKEDKKEIVMVTAGGKQKLTFADEFRILGHLFSRDGRMQISLEENMQTANKAWWRDAKIHRCRSVP